MTEIDGVMFVSASPDGANRQAMEACARTKIPMAGTGGSGVALTQNMGCNVLSASGTTGTTNRTRAVAFTTALAKKIQFQSLFVQLQLSRFLVLMRWELLQVL